MYLSLHNIVYGTFYTFYIQVYQQRSFKTFSCLLMSYLYTNIHCKPFEKFGLYIYFFTFNSSIQLLTKK